ncbi:hypothetical protein BVC80_8929g2 [Macleaya cordata]|uniref:Uncharacterized protein n=1 Tax=Macleaya cordata TaxID=56857 RepID=A0A200R098_MACCD|nr:hypothetical protein BVC80_8929g2 [Macleaya cordata]
MTRLQSANLCRWYPPSPGVVKICCDGSLERLGNGLGGVGLDSCSPTTAIFLKNATPLAIKDRWLAVKAKFRAIR